MRFLLWNFTNFPVEDKNKLGKMIPNWEPVLSTSKAGMPISIMWFMTLGVSTCPMIPLRKLRHGSLAISDVKLGKHIYIYIQSIQSQSIDFPLFQYTYTCIHRVQIIHIIHVIHVVHVINIHVTSNAYKAWKPHNTQNASSTSNTHDSCNTYTFIYNATMHYNPCNTWFIQ